MTDTQRKMANGRYEGANYRFSDRFIKLMTRWLIAYIFIGVGLGFAVGAMGDVFFADTDTPMWYTVLAISLISSGVGLPLLVGAWLGGMAINKYAGPVGLLLVLGIGATAAGSNVAGATMWIWIGIGAIILSVVLFFYVGFQAKVPIWLQLPILKSPRLYLTKDEKSNDDPRNVKNIFK